jgi:multidrug resistance protein, MATE family
MRIPQTWPPLLSLAWPAMTTGFVRIAMRTVDLLVVGAVVGAVGVAAVGIADAAARFVLMLALGLAAGTVATVSQRTGRGDRRGVDAAVTQTLLLAVALGTAATVVGIPAARPFFRLLGAAPAVIDEGAVYLQIVIATAVPRALAIMLSRALQASGDTRTPMAVRVASTLVNIAITVVLVPGLGPFPRLEVVGAAVGTATGNVLSGAALLVILASGRWGIGFRRDALRDFATAREIVRVGTPQIIERGLYALAEIPLNAITLYFGTAVNAGFQVGRRVHLFVRVPAIGVGIAGAAHVGMNIGQGHVVAAERYGTDAGKLALLVGGIGGALLAAFAGPIALAFGGGESPEVLRSMVDWLRVYALALVLLATYEVLRYAMQGAGETRLPLYASAVAIGGFMVGFSWSVGIVLGLGVVGVYAGIVLDAVVRTALVARWWRRGAWQRAVTRSESASGVS